MIADLHNHTTLCHHAEGEPFQYVERAIEKGIKFFGFTDHAPMNFDPTYRMDFSEIDKYFGLIDEVAEKYRGKIEILKGFEVDYLPQYHDNRVLKSNVDYLIGSIHFLQGWGFDNPEFMGNYENVDIDELWKVYFSEMENMAKSGLFQIAGHLDLLKVFKFLPKKNRIGDLVQDTLKAIKKSEMAVEINASGLRKPIAETYPSREILELVRDFNIPITTSSDAHSPTQVGMFKSEIDRLLKDIGFKEIAIFRNKQIELLQI
ncbi:histidinol phosphate phosphatase HisJ family [Thiovulum sp. ES]|nr:histidinol phosphate phosphatase HisJ family [Thiovulum sp. ES]